MQELGLKFQVSRIETLVTHVFWSGTVHVILFNITINKNTVNFFSQINAVCTLAVPVIHSANQVLLIPTM